MKQKTNKKSRERETNEIYTRHVDELHVPKPHDPNCLIVYHHELNQELEEDPKHFASIIVGRRGENLFVGHRASIEVSSNGPSLIFANGIFAPCSRKGSFLVPKIRFPALAAKLYAARVPEYDPDDEDPDDYPEDRIAAFSKAGRTVHFCMNGEDKPCEALRLLQHWNYFEDRGLSWEERGRALSCHPCGNVFLKGFQDDCELLGLKFGQKTPYDKQLNALDACLNVLEVEHWKRIREIAAAALQHAKKNA